MKSMTGLWVACVTAILMIAGCDQMPGMGPGTLVVDLTAVAKAIGQDQSMQDRAEAAREDLNTQLTESARELEQQIEQERIKFGESPTEEQQLQLQQMTQQAQQRYGQLQAEAQQNVQQHEINLVQEFREQVRPFAEKIARSRGAEVVLLADQSVFWLDPAVDITGEVIDALRAQDVFADAVQEPETPAAEE